MILDAGKNMANPSEIIKQKAFELGFAACGVARATRLAGYEDWYKQWLKNGSHGTMDYMERHLEKRLDPQQLFPGAKSVIVFAKNYFPSATAKNNPVNLDHQIQTNNRDDRDSQPINIAKYAWGRDYHYVIKETLRNITDLLEVLAPGTKSRAFVDSAPILERAWAIQAGIGWTGKNSCLIIPKKGSFFFLAEIITTLELTPDNPFDKNYCGSCTRCMDACPTQAIVNPGQIDARKCISYLTIEHKESISPEKKQQCRGWIFGCDICQDVCPHNRFARPNHEQAFTPINDIHTWPAHQWKTLEKKDFKKIFIKGGSPISRVKYEKLLSNLPD